MSILVVIPARYASTRLPGKPLALIDGQPLVWHVVRRARRAGVGPVIVATDDERIVAAVTSRGGEAVMTGADCRTGSDRVARVASRFPEAELVLNLQGDELGIEPDTIAALVRHMGERPEAAMGTAAAPLGDAALLTRPSVVKVEVDDEGWATAFWHTPPRAEPPVMARVAHHLGLYAFRRDALRRFASWEQTPAEREVSLEQLRAMDHGMRITVVRGAAAARAVDTSADLRAARGAP